ncbi:hypothetical protein HELRODRAFT_167138 [Helobdella robusta]|uniref:EGF-like calcium-binding domain-containing protein n=1 Tax=Helobdella robusta TaxID=6412 RepID=T1EZ25_HELRO|nr:hypothetical protein HELRODRAFT_167138 [Helobdella robusta]ESO10630.1 hypothetical protein HELRODRAFT_167138 [Helobdella robusta]
MCLDICLSNEYIFASNMKGHQCMCAMNVTGESHMLEDCLPKNQLPPKYFLVFLVKKGIYTFHMGCLGKMKKQSFVDNCTNAIIEECLYLWYQNNYPHATLVNFLVKIFLEISHIWSRFDWDGCLCTCHPNSHLNVQYSIAKDLCHKVCSDYKDILWCVCDGGGEEINLYKCRGSVKYGEYEICFKDECMDGWTGDHCTERAIIIISFFCMLEIRVETEECRLKELCTSPTPEKCFIDKGGMRICNCSKGYEYGDGDQICVDINECSRASKFCDQSTTYCENEPGGYRCECLLGFHRVDNKMNTGPCYALLLNRIIFPLVFFVSAIFLVIFVAIVTGVYKVTGSLSVKPSSKYGN